jgi:hypothetical protein
MKWAITSGTAARKLEVMDGTAASCWWTRSAYMLYAMLLVQKYKNVFHARCDAQPKANPFTGYIWSGMVLLFSTTSLLYALHYALLYCNNNCLRLFPLLCIFPNDALSLPFSVRASASLYNIRSVFLVGGRKRNETKRNSLLCLESLL